MERFGDVTVTLDDSFVATVEMHRPPENFFEVDVIRSLADAYEALDADPDCRAILLCAEGKHFCAGANIGGGRAAGESDAAPAEGPDQMDIEALRIVGAETPVVAAVQGAAIGAGFGLVCLADFRVGCPEARFSANFARLGYHHILGLSITLPAIVGQQRALELLYTGRRLKGEEAAGHRFVRPSGRHRRAPGRGARLGGRDRRAARRWPCGRSVETMRAGSRDRFRARHDARGRRPEGARDDVGPDRGRPCRRGAPAARFEAR